MATLDRRRFLSAGGLAGIAALLPPELLTACAASTSTPAKTRRQLLFLTEHEASVVEEATARLIPGPGDDPAEAGHPGAREADVTAYIDAVLGAFSQSPPRIFAGGPFSSRAGSPTDDMARFLDLPPAAAWAWKRRIEGWQRQYNAGVPILDRSAGGSFLRASNARRDEVLARDEAGFVSLLFGHAIEAMYSNPEYGGNADLVGWRDIRFPGDVQPRGYTAHEVSRSDGPDPYVPSGAGAGLISLIKISNGL